LKANISNFYDGFLDLKAIVLRLVDENNELKRKVEQVEQGQQGEPELQSDMRKRISDVTSEPLVFPLRACLLVPYKAVD
jgi:hypothetical protein